jgi:putative FmdB family regulatory protein
MIKYFLGFQVGGTQARALGRNYDWVGMPVYEFECEECANRFEELTSGDARGSACPACGSSRTRRLLSRLAPPGRQPRGAKVRSGESQRREREAARGERLVESKRKRAKGEL